MGIKILDATYGGVDVKNVFEKAFIETKTFRANNHIFGDTNPGVLKQLCVTLLDNGKKYNYNIMENDKFCHYSYEQLESMRLMEESADATMLEYRKSTHNVLLLTSCNRINDVLFSLRLNCSIIKERYSIIVVDNSTPYSDQYVECDKLARECPYNKVNIENYCADVKKLDEASVEFKKDYYNIDEFIVIHVGTRFEKQVGEAHLIAIGLAQASMLGNENKVNCVKLTGVSILKNDIFYDMYNSLCCYDVVTWERPNLGEISTNVFACVPSVLLPNLLQADWYTNNTTIERRFEKLLAKSNVKVKSSGSKRQVIIEYYNTIAERANAVNNIIKNRSIKVATKSSDTVPKKVSFICTTYGRFTCVRRIVAQYLAQTYKNKELIIFNTDIDNEYTLGFEDDSIVVVNCNTDYVLGKPYTNRGDICRDAVVHATGEYFMLADDDDIYLPYHIQQAVDGITHNKKDAWKPELSFYCTGGRIIISGNVMEASVIVKMDRIREIGFRADKTGLEGMSWYSKLQQEGQLDGHNKDYVPSYCFNWGDPTHIGGQKQSSDIDNPDNFDNHKIQCNDYAVKPLTPISADELELVYSPYYDHLSSNLASINIDYYNKYTKVFTQTKPAIVEIGRVQVINKFALKYNYQSYLEIGIETGSTINDCIINNKIGVDIDSSRYIGNHKIINCTSDEYFESLDDNVKFDLIFIDGNHDEHYVYRDAINAIKHLNVGGTIVLHDCNPAEEWRTSLSVNGTCYKALIKIVQEYNIEYYTVDTDEGCAVLKPNNINFDNKNEVCDFDFAYFDVHRKDLLNLISVQEFLCRESV